MPRYKVFESVELFGMTNHNRALNIKVRRIGEL
jgi:hypothetical protein